MQLVSNSRQSGQFILTRESGKAGHIIFKDGEIVDSFVDTFKGEDALFTLLAWGKGEFSFEEGNFAEDNTISRSITSLLMEAAKRVDEWKLLRKKVGSIDAVPVFSELDKTERRKISLSTLEWIVISKIDGKLTLDQISKASGINIFDTARIIFGMLTSGLLTLAEA